MDNLQRNGFQRRSLLQMEAILLAQVGYPCPPDTRPPHDWVLSVGGVPVPPAPRVATPAFTREVEAARAQMSPEERANPVNTANNTAAWDDYFQLRRAEAIASINGNMPLVGRHNRDGRLRWWSEEGRTLEWVLTYIENGNTPRLQYPPMGYGSAARRS